MICSNLEPKLRVFVFGCVGRTEDNNLYDNDLLIRNFSVFVIIEPTSHFTRNISVARGDVKTASRYRFTSQFHLSRRIEPQHHQNNNSNDWTTNLHNVFDINIFLYHFTCSLSTEDQTQTGSRVLVLITSFAKGGTLTPPRTRPLHASTDSDAQNKRHW